MVISEALGNIIINHLIKIKFIGKIHPWQKNSTHPPVLSVLIRENVIEKCLDEIGHKFPSLRKPITVRRFKNQDPVQYFECILSKQDLRELLERNNILILKDDEDFYKKKKEWEYNISIMNKVEYLRNNYLEHSKKLAKAA